MKIQIINVEEKYNFLIRIILAFLQQINLIIVKHRNFRYDKANGWLSFLKNQPAKSFNNTGDQYEVTPNGRIVGELAKGLFGKCFMLPVTR